MESPPRRDLPFFAYGVFKPDQLGYLRVSDLVVRVEPAAIPGALRIRDGLPIVDPTSTSQQVSGYLLHLFFAGGTHR